VRLVPFSLAGLAAFALPMSAPAMAEPYQDYLSRLKEICSVDCMQPRQFQRTARKRGKSDQADMALIMDVAYVELSDNRLELHNLDLESSHFEDLINLESAGIDISSRTGVGGLPRGRGNSRHPNLIIIELDEQAVRDLLRPLPYATESAAVGSDDGDADILVEGDPGRKVERLSRTDLTELFRNRRVVVRGTPRLEATLIGARRDFRRKQVTLVVDDAADLAILPRFDDDGNAVLAN